MNLLCRGHDNGRAVGVGRLQRQRSVRLSHVQGLHGPEEEQAQRRHPHLRAQAQQRGRQTGTHSGTRVIPTVFFWTPAQFGQISNVIVRRLEGSRTLVVWHGRQAKMFLVFRGDRWICALFLVCSVCNAKETAQFENLTHLKKEMKRLVSFARQQEGTWFARVSLSPNSRDSNIDSATPVLSTTCGL